MPKRTNIFQRLVKLLHDRLDENWEVTESEMLCNRVTGEDREVDIVLRYKLGMHKIIVSIECTDTKRPVSSTWVEAMAKKHEFLPTSKLILWSASGFFKPAAITAEKLGIEIVSQNDNIDVEWAALSKILKEGSLKVVHSSFSFFIDVFDTNGEKIRLEGPYNYLFRGKDKETFFTILQLREYVMNLQEVGTALLDHATNDKGDFWIRCEPRFECQVQKENGDWVEPFRIGFGIKAIVEETKAETRSIKYQNTVSTLGVGKLRNGSLEIFIEEKPGQNPKVSSQIKKEITLTRHSSGSRKPRGPR
jgi:hypothetical protein